jgi:hypothetical protein
MSNSGLEIPGGSNYRVMYREVTLQAKARVEIRKLVLN